MWYLNTSSEAAAIYYHEKSVEKMLSLSCGGGYKYAGGGPDGQFVARADAVAVARVQQKRQGPVSVSHKTNIIVKL